MNRQKLIVSSGIAGGQTLVSISKAEIPSETGVFDRQRHLIFQERNTLEKEFVMWKAASADVGYIQNMQAHNI